MWLYFFMISSQVAPLSMPRIICASCSVSCLPLRAAAAAAEPASAPTPALVPSAGGVGEDAGTGRLLREAETQTHALMQTPEQKEGSARSLHPEVPPARPPAQGKTMLGRRRSLSLSPVHVSKAHALIMAWR